MVVFDDTEDKERVGFGAQATDRLDPTSAGIHSILDSSQKTIHSQSDGDSIVEAGQTVSIRCKDFKLEASNSIDIEAGSATILQSGQSTTIDGGATAKYNAEIIQINPSSAPPEAKSAKDVPDHIHPPAKPAPLETLGGGAAMATAAIGEDQGAAGEIAEGAGGREGAPADGEPGDAGTTFATRRRLRSVMPWRMLLEARRAIYSATNWAQRLERRR